MPSKQETFDFTVNFLKAQGRPSVREGTTSCMYKSPDGCKCAAGANIPDELYDPEMDSTEHNMFGESWDSIVVRYNLESLGINKGLMLDLQRAHDLIWCDITDSEKLESFKNHKKWLELFLISAKRIADSHHLDGSYCSLETV